MHTLVYNRSTSPKHRESAGSYGWQKTCSCGCHKKCTNQPTWDPVAGRRALPTIFDNTDRQARPLSGCLLPWQPKDTWRNWTGMRSHPAEHPNPMIKFSFYIEVVPTWQAAWTLGYNVDKALCIIPISIRPQIFQSIESWHFGPLPPGKT